MAGTHGNCLDVGFAFAAVSLAIIAIGAFACAMYAVYAAMKLALRRPYTLIVRRPDGALEQVVHTAPGPEDVVTLNAAPETVPPTIAPPPAFADEVEFIEKVNA